MRQRGTQCYGVGSAFDIEDTTLGFGAHSDQERILEQGAQDFFKFAWHVVSEVAAKQ
ncbi:MAG: hypothetical protein H7039_22060 [Bryobacteraceae bacterium]|nr:hypothetical protein [Bryobacteraceae bacterium]